MEGEYTAENEKRWVERARSGDAKAFEQLYARYKRPIYAHIYRMMGSVDEANDLTQDTFLRAYRGLANTPPDLNFSAWLHRIAHNLCMDHLRRRQKFRWQPWENQKHDDLLHVSTDDHPEQGGAAARKRGARCRKC